VVWLGHDLALHHLVRVRVRVGVGVRISVGVGVRVRVLHDYYLGSRTMQEASCISLVFERRPVRVGVRVRSR